MKFQAFVEKVSGDSVHLLIMDTPVILPRRCLPAGVQEADILDMVVFINEKETEKRLNDLRHWLRACAVVQARQQRAR